MATLNVPNRTLFIGDNLDVLRGINSESVDLIATDPPFNKGVKAFEGITTAGDNVSYSDVWTWDDVQAEWTAAIFNEHPALYSVIQAANASAGDDMGAFLCWLAVRVLEMRRILKPTGSLYLHIDHTAHAYAKAMLDAIFGRKQFRNEIVWQRTSGRRAANHWGNAHDILLFYTKTSLAPFKPQYTELAASAAAHYRYSDNKGVYRVDNVNAPERGTGGYYYSLDMGERPPGNGYRFPRERALELLAEGRLIVQNGKVPVQKRYLAESKGTQVNTVQTDVPPVVGANKSERTGYPTQKPLALYERIIKASSNEGDVVLDPFAGCATTCVAAERLGRQWIGIDINERALTVIRDRLQSEVIGSMAWDTIVGTPQEPPTRTDGGKAVAPELRVVSRKRNAPRLPTREIRERLKIEDGQRCQGCGWQPPYLDYLQVDHKKPRSLGGADEMDNYTLLCDPCNRLKGNKLTLTELRDARVKEGRVDAVWWSEERWR